MRLVRTEAHQRAKVDDVARRPDAAPLAAGPAGREDDALAAGDADEIPGERERVAPGLRCLGRGGRGERGQQGRVGDFKLGNDARDVSSRALSADDGPASGTHKGAVPDSLEDRLALEVERQSAGRVGKAERDDRHLGRPWRRQVEAGVGEGVDRRRLDREDVVAREQRLVLRRLSRTRGRRTPAVSRSCCAMARGSPV
jgi:hypothetical protein